ncbi:MAG TPA: hypothetical protein VMI10_25765 [Terriglobales bacterium]|nr:hypothetical protein [Terriglobales bacterium]
MTATSSNSARAFRLRGKIYRLSRTDVERAAAKAEPRPTEKYAVRMGGRSFPPKQLIELSLKLPPTSFTTLDASRILKKLGFEVFTPEQEIPSEGAPQHRHRAFVEALRSDGKSPSDQGWADLLLEPALDARLQRLKTWLRETALGTRAKDLFEAYLLTLGLDALQVDRQSHEFGGAIDFVVSLGEKRMAFEVTDFAPIDFDIGSEVELYNPYRPIRDRIIAAEFDLKNVDNASRCAVLHNRCLSWPILDWRFMYESIFSGSEVIRNPALLQKESGQRRPRTLDAVVVIDRLRIGYLRFQAQIAAQEIKLKRTISPADYMLELQHARGTERDILLSRLRVIVYQNPNASNPLPKDIFRGSYDEWYGSQNDGVIGRTFAGSEIQHLATKNPLVQGQ